MKICVYGAGAIGGFLAARLAAAGAEVTIIARGPHLEAIRSRGLTLRFEGREEVLPIPASDDPAEVGPQDYVILTLKVPALAGIAEAAQPLLGPETALVTAQNGLPWWYFHRHGGALEGQSLKSLDPEGLLWRSLPPERCLGCVVYAAADVPAPGVIDCPHAGSFPLGEPDGSDSPRLRALAEVLEAAGVKAPLRARIREEIWVKLLGNLTYNPISVLTLGTMGPLSEDPGTRAAIRRMMEEAWAVAEALGVSFPVDIETRIGMAAKLGAFKTSMLQDLERGRAMEIDALVTAVSEIGGLLGIATPTIDTVLGLVIHRARLAGCYPKQEP